MTLWAGTVVGQTQFVTQHVTNWKRQVKKRNVTQIGGLKPPPELAVNQYYEFRANTPKVEMTFN